MNIQKTFGKTCIKFEVCLDPDRADSPPICVPEPCNPHPNYIIGHIFKNNLYICMSACPVDQRPLEGVHFIQLFTSTFSYCVWHIIDIQEMFIVKMD